MIRLEVKLLEQEMCALWIKQLKIQHGILLNTFMELIQVENIEKNMAKNIEETQYGNNKNEGDNPFGK